MLISLHADGLHALDGNWYSSLAEVARTNKLTKEGMQHRLKNKRQKGAWYERQITSTRIDRD